MARITGRADISDDFGEMRYKKLSFYDYDEDKEHVDTSTANEDTMGDTMCFDEDDYDSLSDDHDVDEGAVEVLSIDEIRGMKTPEP